MKNSKPSDKIKITKKQVDEVLAKGITHANFTNKNVQRRLLKNQEKVRRAQALRENFQKKISKVTQKAQEAKAASQAIPTGAYVDAQGKIIDNAKVIADAVEILGNSDFIDTCAPGPEIRYMREGEDEEEVVDVSERARDEARRDWDKVREQVEANGDIRNTHLVAEMPRHPPARVLTGSTEGVYPLKNEFFPDAPPLSPFDTPITASRTQMFRSHLGLDKDDPVEKSKYYFNMGAGDPTRRRVGWSDWDKLLHSIQGVIRREDYIHINALCPEVVNGGIPRDQMDVTSSEAKLKHFGILSEVGKPNGPQPYRQPALRHYSESELELYPGHESDQASDGHYEGDVTPSRSQEEIFQHAQQIIDEQEERENRDRIRHALGEFRMRVPNQAPHAPDPDGKVIAKPRAEYKGEPQAEEAFDFTVPNKTSVSQFPDNLYGEESNKSLPDIGEIIRKDSNSEEK